MKKRKWREVRILGREIVSQLTGELGEEDVKENREWRKHPKIESESEYEK